VAARLLTALADGTAIHWSARPDGGLCERLRGDLIAVVDGWRGSESRSQRRSEEGEGA
jgi:hypothetical protein